MKKTEKIAIISQLEIGMMQMAMLALVVLGKIPAIELNLYTHNTENQEAFDLLCLLGIPVFAVRLPPNKVPSHVATYCISNSTNDASILSTLVDVRNFSSQKMNSCFHISYGALMGYPLSAIEGFVKNNTLPDEQYPACLKNELLTVFKLSKNNWQQETKLIMSWRKILSRDAPEILARLDAVIVKS